MSHLLAREAWTADAKTASPGERGTFAPMAGKYFTYGGDYPSDTQDFGQADQFQQTTQCGRPFGANSTHCATVVK